MKNFIKKLDNFDGTIYLKRAIAQMDVESAKLKMEKGALMLSSPELKEMQSAGESALEETVAVAAEGIAIEAIPAVSAPRNGSASTLDVHTDFGGPLWRAA